MGYRGKVEQQDKARLLRAEHRTLQEIADRLGVSKSSVSLWCRDMDVEIRRKEPVARRPHAQHLAKLAEIDACNAARRRSDRPVVGGGLPRGGRCPLRRGRSQG